jgi:hypothetical protein
MERVGLVEGPPAGVLLVLSVTSFALVSAVFGFILSLRRLRKGGRTLLREISVVHGPRKTWRAQKVALKLGDGITP